VVWWELEQLGAFVLGLSRALAAIDEGVKPVLRKKGLLTRDQRVRERRKVGTGGKARRQKQSPKR
jgi:small subunit ribosomal protein S9